MTREFKPTDEQRVRVAIAAGGGMSHEEISIGLGISRDTLEKHFEVELSEGAYFRRAEVVAAMHSAALKGNASAAREYLSRTPQAAAPPAEVEGDAGIKKAPKLGKKEQKDKDAISATKGTDWDDLIGPRRMQ